MRIIEVAFSGTIGTPRMGPVSSDTCELSNQFAARGHDVTVVDVATEERRTLLDSRIRVVQIPGPPPRQAGLRPRSPAGLVQMWRNYHRCVRAIAKAVDLDAADVIHYHVPIPACIAQRLYPQPIAYTAHTPIWSLDPGGRIRRRLNERESLAGGILRQIGEHVERSVILRSRPAIGLGRYLANAVPEADVRAIPNGVNPESFVPVDRKVARAALGFAERDFVVLSVGRLVPVKGFDTLIEATRRVSARPRRLKVLIVGPLSGYFDVQDRRVSPYVRSLMDRARDLPVEFLGFIGHHDPRFRQLMSGADVFVMPSHLEAQGLVVMEALAMGTPVIGSETGGIPDMVTDRVGYLYPPGDAGALAERIREACEDEQGWLRRQAACRAWVETNFSWQVIADRYLAAFDEALVGSCVAARARS